ncbi:MAG: SdpI family protein [Oscillospiraceae bacterium]|nr:SdpI family protein [Oscillospiraceae bacterium]
MFMWVFMTGCCLLLPVLLYRFGKFFENDDSTEINYAFGYRTSRSMQNLDTWRFAQKYWGRLRKKTAAVCFVMAIIPMVLVFGKSTDTVGTAGGIICMAQLIPMLTTIPKTEKALKETFDDEGNFRN